MEIFAAGEQAHVPLLVGWNAEEMSHRAITSQDEPTAENFGKAVRRLYADRADEALKLYPASTAEEALQSATDLASNRFIGYSTWQWCDLHRRTGGRPVYRYFYTDPRPPMTSRMRNATPDLAGGVLRGSRSGNPKFADASQLTRGYRRDPV